MAEFMAGVCVRDITPPAGAPLWGYGDRTGPATGTLDPLHAKAVVFRAADQAAAVVMLDLGRAPTQTVRRRIAERVRAAHVDYVFLSATHTHHAPVMEMEDADYILPIEDKIVEAIVEASATAKPARLGTGRTQIDIGHNRRIVKDGKCQMLWRNEAHTPTSPVDKEAIVLRLDGVDGAPIATIVNYACHPVIMGPTNLEYSADYVGEMCRLVEDETQAPCLFLQGGCGDINPYYDKTAIDDGAVSAMRKAGETCAKAVLALWPDIETKAPEKAAVAYSEQDVHVGSRWDLRDLEQQQIYAEAHGGLSGFFSFYLQKAKPDLAVPLSMVVLNNEIVLVGVPGEFFTYSQQVLKAGSPLDNTLLCGYVNDWHAYFPPLRDAVAGGYGGTMASYVGLGAADKVLTEGLIEVARLIGDGLRKCTPLDFEIIDYDPTKEGQA